MGLFQAAVTTYDNLASAGMPGRYVEGLEPLAPVGHIITRADIEITLDANGHFLHSARIPKDMGKIIISVSEGSAGRTSKGIPHPLCEQIKYLAGYDQASAARCQEYLEQLSGWKDSSFSDPKLDAIYNYVSGGTILDDLSRDGNIHLQNGKPTAEDEKALIVWSVQGVNLPAEVYKDRQLMRCYTGYYLSRKAQQPEVLDMISGQQQAPAQQHLKGVFSLDGNAKLISSNDKINFTWRGRFDTPDQALTIGYESSQKAHNALKWVTTNFGKTYGGRAFVCWSPEGDSIPDPSEALLGDFFEDLEAPRQYDPGDYRQALAKALLGYESILVDPDDSSTVIVSFDAATSGRLAVTYYHEMRTDTYLHRLKEWDTSCAWYRSPGEYVYTPSLPMISRLAFGEERDRTGKGQIDVDDNIHKQTIERLIRCRLENGIFPYDIERRLVENASEPWKYGRNTRRQMLTTACAVVRKYHYDRWREDIGMELDQDRKDRSYQYGRLLAVYEKMERDTYGPDESREPNAIQLQSVYCNRPLHYAYELDKQMERAYVPRLKPGARVFYKNLIGEIMDRIHDCPEAEWDKPLGDTYLVGYYLQRKALYTKAEDKKAQE